MGLISYLAAGEPILASQMNSLVEELDDAITGLLSGKSPFAFIQLGEAYGLENKLFSIPFFFGDPARRRVLAGTTWQYSEDPFDDIFSSVSYEKLDIQRRRYVIGDVITDAQWEAVANAVGQHAKVGKSITADVWPLDWSLRPYRATVNSVKLWLQYLQDDGNEVQPWEHLHDRAVAEIVFEGMVAGTYSWPREWSKFGCLRLHNLDLKPLEILFEGLGSSVKIPALGCKAVRLGGCNDGLRTTFDQSFNYFWKFDDGYDQPVYDGPRNLSRGVWGTSGFNPLCSVPVMHEWLNRFAGVAYANRGFFFDPRVTWNGSSAYASKFAPTSDDTKIARMLIHGGAFKASIVVDGELTCVSDTAQWQSNSLVSQTLSFTPNGSNLVIASKVDGRLDVAPVSTNVIGELPVAMEGVEKTFSMSLPSYGRARLKESNQDASAIYYDEEWNTIEVSATWEMAEEEGDVFARKSAFIETIGDCKALKAEDENSPDNNISVHSDRSVAFDGRGLWMRWSVTHPIGRPWQAGGASGTEIFSNPAAFEFGDSSVTSFISSLIAGSPGSYDLLPCRLVRHTQDGIGFKRGGVWVFSDHPESIQGDNASGEDWTLLDPPSPTETDISIHGVAPATVDTRSHRLFPLGSNLERAIATIQDPVEWGAHRSEILAGTMTDEDRRRILRIPGAIEHFNLLAARLNAMTCIMPYQLTDLLAYGAPFHEDSAGVEITPRHAVRLDANPAAKALAVEFALPVSNYSEIQALVDAAERDATPYIGRDGTWLRALLPLIGWPSSDDLPAGEWLTLDALANASRRLGVPLYRIELSVPFAVDVAEETSSNGYYVESAAMWNTIERGDFSTRLDDFAVLEISKWRNPVKLSADANRNDVAVDVFANSFPTPGDVFAHPFQQYRGARLDKIEEVPRYARGWAWEDRSRLIVWPMPHFRYANQVPADFGGGFEQYFARIEAVAKPPVSAKAIDVASFLSGSGYLNLHPDTIRSIGWPTSEDWGTRTMTWITLVRQMGLWRV